MEDKIKTKVCSKCNAEFPSTNEFFSKDKGGLRADCKICQKQYRSDNKKHQLEYQKQYRAENVEYRAEYGKQYYHENAERLAVRAKQYRIENAEYIAMRAKQYAKSNAKRIAELLERYRVENTEHISEYGKQYRKENAEQIVEYAKQYRKNNKEYFVAATQRRVAIKESLISDFTMEQWKACLLYFDYEDAYTGLPLSSPSQDHVIPLSKGGHYTADNIVPCERNINSSKGNRDMLTWFRKQTYYNTERENKILAYLRNGFENLALEA